MPGMLAWKWIRGAALETLGVVAVLAFVAATPLSSSQNDREHAPVKRLVARELQISDRAEYTARQLDASVAYLTRWLIGKSE